MSEPTELIKSSSYEDLLNVLTNYKPFDKNVQWSVKELENPPVDIDSNTLKFLLLSEQPYTYEDVKKCFESDTNLLLTTMATISNRFHSRDIDQIADSKLFTKNEEILMFTGYSFLRNLYNESNDDSLLPLIKSTRDNIIHSNLGLVKFTIYKKYIFLREDIPLEDNDLIQETYFVLMNACDHFKVEYGNRFSTFTEACIKNYLLKFKTNKKTIETKSIGLSEYEQLPDSMNLEDIVEEKILIDELKTAFDSLKDKHQDIINLKYGLNNNRVHTFKEISNIYGTTGENIRQSKRKAEKKLMKYFTKKEYI